MVRSYWILRTARSGKLDFGRWLQQFLLLFAGFFGACVSSRTAEATPPYIVKVWGVEDGLPGSSVTDVAQSDCGYLWVSTEEGGLCRFDGVRFVNFRIPIQSGFLSRGVRRMFATDDGRLWFNGFGGFLASQSDGTFRWDCSTAGVVNELVLSDADRVVFATEQGNLLEGQFGSGTNETWQTIILPGATPNTMPVDRIFADRQGGIWYETTNNQVARFVGGKIEPMVPGATNSLVTAFAGDKEGRIAIGTTDGLFIWSAGHFERILSDDSTPLLSVRYIVSDGQGGWWVDVNDRFRRLQKGRWVAEVSGWSGLHVRWPRVVQELPDGQGGIWMAFKRQGLFHILRDGKLYTISTAEGLPSNAVRNFMLDHDGDVWACFERGGLAKVSLRTFQAIGKNEGFPEVVTTSVCETSNGMVWAGTAGGRVTCWAHGECTNFTLPIAGRFCIRCTVFPDSQGRIWIGTWGNGVLVYEDGKFRHITSSKDNDLKVVALLVAHDGRVWIASQEGLYCVTNNRVRRVLASQSVTDYPTALTEGSDGVIWAVTTAAELIRYQNGQIETFRPSNPNLLCRFTSLLEDTNGTVWIGTVGAGLLCFREGHFSAIGTEAGLPTENIFSLLEDGCGNVWFGSGIGIFSAKKTDLEKSLRSTTNIVSCRLYGRDDGLPTLGCAEDSQPAAWRDRKGRLWFAMTDGIASVLPSEMPIDRHHPLVMIEELNVDGKPQKLPPDTLGSKEVLLPAGRHLLQFRYTALDYAHPNQLLFKYRLEGLDTDWKEQRQERIATYSSVPPGRYCFEVMACNSNGVWSKTAATLAFNIPPHLWETPWFRYSILAGIVTAIGMVGFGTVRLRHNRQIRLLQQSRAVESERARIAQDLHDDLGTTLTQIDLLGALASRPGVPANEALEKVGTMRTKSREMVTALDEIVWAVNPRNDSVKALVGYLGHFAEDFLGQAIIPLYLDFPDDLPDATLTAEVRHNLFLAYKEALNNAVCHSGTSEVGIRFVNTEHQASFIIQDNGKGFKVAYESTETGNGLVNMRQRLERIGGHCEVISRQGNGTTVKLIFPIR